MQLTLTHDGWRRLRPRPPDAMFARMKHVGITLSDAQQAFLHEQITRGGYADIGEYIAALIDADARAKAQARLEELLLEGLEGEATEWTQADTERLERLAVGGR